ncbi:hypothetical protein EZV62_022014 [Acer yangbiense]|uniref:CCHC-type domain-containing protein n=1 Tax=Acer yangbiense TaxID=1000413 RepID=A0A5C7H8P7_9ROSI|nr:hypothetical protein EZV62_022014 [Acer yangbiense]
MNDNESSAEDRRQVLEGSPWTFDGALIVLEDPSGKGYVEDMSFSHSDFWVQIHRAPLFCLIEEITRFLGGMIGVVLDVDVGMPGDDSGKFLCVRVRIHIGKPLHRCLLVDLLGDGKEKVMLIWYERLPNHCYRCGRLGHPSRECLEAGDGHASTEPGSMPFGAWLKASTPDWKASHNGRRREEKRGELKSGTHRIDGGNSSNKGSAGVNGGEIGGNFSSVAIKQGSVTADFVFKSQCGDGVGPVTKTDLDGPGSRGSTKQPKDKGKGKTHRDLTQVYANGLGLAKPNDDLSLVGDPDGLG